MTQLERNKTAIERAVRLFSPDTLDDCLQLYPETATLHFLPPVCRRAAPALVSSISGGQVIRSRRLAFSA